MMKILKIVSVFEKHKKAIAFSVVLLMAVASLFIHQRNSHDWGGDFGMYLQQAENISTGQDISKNHYLFNPDYAVLGPRHYPAGFPILLSPLFVSGNPDIEQILLLMGIFLSVYGFAGFLFFRRKTSELVAVGIAFVLLFNHWLLQIKTQILADLPFAFFFVFSIYLLQQKKRYLIPAILTVSAAILVKSAGWIIPVALLIETVLNFIRKREFSLKNEKENLIATVSIAALVLTINKLILQIPGGASLYANHFSISNLPGNINTSAEYLLKVSAQFMNPYNENFTSIAFVLKTLFVALMLFGMLRRIPSRIKTFDVITLSYLLLLLIYPYHAAGIRFLLPILPVLLYYAVEGIRMLSLETRTKKVMRIMVFLVIALLYLGPVIRMEQRESQMKDGPYTKESKDLFNFIESNTLPGDVFAFAKPRVLGYFTKRQSFAPNPRNKPVKVRNLINENSTDYILIYKNLPQPALEAYVHQQQLKSVYQKNGFELYQIE